MEVFALFNLEGTGENGSGSADMGQELSWLEHTTDNREVDGSSPFWPTTSKYESMGFGGLAQLGERLPCKQEVSGSIPLISTRNGPVAQLARACD